MVKVETNTVVNLKTRYEVQYVKIGLIDRKGNLQHIRFNYKITNGKVKAL